MKIQNIRPYCGDDDNKTIESVDVTIRMTRQELGLLIMGKKYKEPVPVRFERMSPLMANALSTTDAE